MNIYICIYAYTNIELHASFLSILRVSIMSMFIDLLSMALLNLLVGVRLFDIDWREANCRALLHAPRTSTM